MEKRRIWDNTEVGGALNKLIEVFRKSSTQEGSFLKYINGITDRLRRVPVLEQDNDRLRAEIEKLKEEIRKKDEEIEKLTKPRVPEWVKSDIEVKRGRRKKIGARVGHKSVSRKPIEESQVTQEILIRPDQCPCCGRLLGEPVSWHEHIQIDLPERRKLEVTKYILGRSYCSGCQKLVGAKQAVLDTGRLKQCKYGPKLHAHVSYLKYGLGLSLGKIQTQLKEAYNLAISTGQIAEMLTRLSRSLDPVYADFLRVLPGEKVLFADETGWRNRGRNHQLWSFSNDRFSFYKIHKSRGSKVVRAVLGEKFKGVLVSDFYGGYNKIKARKQKCWAHLLREAKEIEKKYSQDLAAKIFKKKLKLFFTQSNRLRRYYDQGEDVDQKLEMLKQRTAAFAELERTNPELKRLSKRIIKYLPELYTFVTTDAEATNNHAEREIRPAVLMRKNQYGNRSEQGAHSQQVQMSMIQTCRKQGINYVDLATKYLTQGLS